MESNLPQKELIIAVVENDGSVLLRKKPAGSPPYKETWYLCGCEPIAGQDDVTTIKNYLREQFGIAININIELLERTSEVKRDKDGIEKNFMYINVRCHYLSGTAKAPKETELVEWVTKENLKNYDLVPPSITLFKTIGYL